VQLLQTLYCIIQIISRRFKGSLKQLGIHGWEGGPEVVEERVPAVVAVRVAGPLSRGAVVGRRGGLLEQQVVREDGGGPLAAD